MNPTIQAAMLVLALSLALGFVIASLFNYKKLYRSFTFYRKALPLDSPTLDAISKTEDLYFLKCSQCTQEAKVVGKLQGHTASGLFCLSCLKQAIHNGSLVGPKHKDFLIIRDYEANLRKQAALDLKCPLRQTTIEMEKAIHEIEMKKAYDPFNL